MMTTRECADFEARGVLDRYVAGKGTAAETEEFERHLIGCPYCQQGAELGAAVRSHSSRPAVAARTGTTRGPAWRRWAALAAAAAVVGIIAYGARWTAGRPLRQLGDVGALPPYGGIEVRASSIADSLFAQGMRHYAEGRRDEAMELLMQSRANGDSMPASFFIGVLHVAAGDAGAALPELAAAAGRQPYTAEAHYYIAKAWLQLGRVDSAQVHLRLADGGATDIATRARALADSVAAMRGRGARR